jgi:hypothetical protein
MEIYAFIAIAAILTLLLHKFIAWVANISLSELYQSYSEDYITASYFMIMSLLAWLVFFILTAGIYNSFC